MNNNFSFLINLKTALVNAAGGFITAYLAQLPMPYCIGAAVIAAFGGSANDLVAWKRNNKGK